MISNLYESAIGAGEGEGERTDRRGPQLNEKGSFRGVATEVDEKVPLCERGGWSCTRGTGTKEREIGEEGGVADRG